MIVARYRRHARAGGVYIAVLGTALVVSVLGLATLLVQRIQNRQLSASTDMRQAQLNAESAVELALLTMKQDATWRNDNLSGRWFTDRGTGVGTCTLDVVDPVDDDLADDDGDPVVILGIGNSGGAQQRIELTIDPKKEPLGCLRSAVAVGGDINLSGDTLRVTGRITAADVSASASLVFGDVEALSISGSTFSGDTTQVSAELRPVMPDWQSVFDYYLANGTQINYGSLPSTTGNPPGYLGSNVGFENDTTDWTGEPPGIPKSDLESKNSPVHSGAKSAKVKGRTEWYSGAAQLIDTFVKPGQQYTIDVWINLQQGVAESFQISIYTKGTGGTAQFVTGPDALALKDIWVKTSATLTAPPWSSDLEYAFVKIAGANASNDKDFIIDDFSIRETTTGRFIYRQVLSPSINPFGGTNAQGIYWIDCGGNRLIIERSRILGTLLVINPGANSCVGDGPIHWSPAVAGYPALLVDADNASDADFFLRATNRVLSEKENGVNFNPAGAAHSEFGQDADTSDIYQSVIQGLVAIGDDLAFENAPLIRGQMIVGGDIAGGSGTLEVEFAPDSLLAPPPGFLAPNSYPPRPGSATKAVLP